VSCRRGHNRTLLRVEVPYPPSRGDDGGWAALAAGVVEGAAATGGVRAHRVAVVEPVGIEAGAEVGVGEDVAHDELGRVMPGPGGLRRENEIGAHRDVAGGEDVDDGARLAAGQWSARVVREPDVRHIEVRAVEWCGELEDLTHLVSRAAEHALGLHAAAHVGQRVHQYVAGAECGGERAQFAVFVDVGQRAQHGRRWRRQATADLVWMLRTGVAVKKAVARIQRLVGIDYTVETARSVVPDTLGASPRTSTERKAHVTADQPLAGAFRSKAADANGDRFDEAMRLNRQHWLDTAGPISAETLRQSLHVSADISRGLIRAVREADRAAVIAAASPS
jgi:hypothetical protein